MRKVVLVTILVVLIPSLVGAKLQIYDAQDFTATKGFSVVPGITPDGTVSLDTLNVYSPSTAVTLRRVKGARNFKGPNDDTLRLVVVQSANPRAVLLLTDTSSNAFAAFRRDSIFSVASYPQGLALGDIDNDGYTEIFIANFGSPKWFYVGKWSGTSFEFDSITVTQDSVFNLAFADADNDGLGEVCIPAGNKLYVLQRWVSSQDYTMDTIDIGDRITAVAVGDLIPYFTGNEIYVAGNKIYMVYQLPDYVPWRVYSIYNSTISLVHSMAIGDVDTTNLGEELVLVHGGTNYQVSVWSLYYDVINEFEVNGKAWKISDSWTSNIATNPADVDVGDVSDVGPADEVVVASGWASPPATSPSYLFWIDGQGNAYKYALPEPSSTRAECGVYVGNINKYCDRKQEFVLTGGSSSGRVVLYQERFLDVSVDTIYPSPYVFKQGQNATYYVEVKNRGNVNVNSLNLNYVHNNQHAYDGSYAFSGVIYPSKKISIPVNIQYNFLGCDTVNFTADYTGDQNTSNNTRNFVFEVWSDSTLAASLFNSSYFPPAGWAVTRGQNVDYVWGWYDTCIVVPLEFDVTPADTLSTAVLEGAGCAGYPFFYVEQGNSRLITNPFVITGNSRKRIVSRFYMLHSYSAYVEGYNDTISVEVFDGSNFIPKGIFTRELTPADNPYCRWDKHEVVLGDYAPDVTLRVAFNAISAFGGYSYIDSVWIFATSPGPEFVFNVSSDIGKFRNTDNYWIRIKPVNSHYGIDSAFIYYQYNNGSKDYTKSSYDSVDSYGYYYFTIENTAPAQNHSISFYFVFYDDSPWKYANRYPETGEIDYQILPISSNLPTSFAFAVSKSNLTSGVFHFRYALPEPSSVDICVYSVTGQKVATLVKGNKDAGFYDLKWNGKSDSGSKLPVGVYIVKMLTPKKTFSEKIIISR